MNAEQRGATRCVLGTGLRADVLYFPGRGRRGSGLPARQRGAALVMGLFMLVVLTFLALAALQSVRLQERIAGNAYASSEVFSKTEYALNGVERCLNARKDKEGGIYRPKRLNEDLTSTTQMIVDPPGYSVATLFDPERLASWNEWDKEPFEETCLNADKTEDLFRRSTVAPWVVVEQLPSVQQDESLEAGKKRDTDVFRITTLGADADLVADASKATNVVILQSILWR
jgi:Tfp pilus assembly protein PilX